MTCYYTLLKVIIHCLYLCQWKQCKLTQNIFHFDADIQRIVDMFFRLEEIVR